MTDRTESAFAVQSRNESFLTAIVEELHPEEKKIKKDWFKFGDASSWGQNLKFLDKITNETYKNEYFGKWDSTAKAAAASSWTATSTDAMDSLSYSQAYMQEIIHHKYRISNEWD